MNKNVNEMESVVFNLAIDRQKEFRAAKKKWLKLRERMLSMLVIVTILEVFASWMYVKGCIEHNPWWGTSEVVMCVGLCVGLCIASWFWFTRTYFSVQRAVLGQFKK